MKRDWELVRKILLTLEKQPEAVAVLRADEVKGFPPQMVAYHFKIMAQAGLIEVSDHSAYDGLNVIAHGLTWQGHEFLRKVGNDDVWLNIKSALIEKGVEWSFEMVTRAADYVCRNVFK